VFIGIAAVQASSIENDFLLGRARVTAALLLCPFVLAAASRRQLQQIFCPQPR
jgi:hypothetical protein